VVINQSAPEKQKETTMTDIINSNKKHAIFTGTKDDGSFNVGTIAIVKEGKAKVYHFDTEEYQKPLSELANKSVDDLEKIGDKAQQDQGFPKAYFTPAHVWLSEQHKDEIQYELRGYMSYTSQYLSDEKAYELGKSEDEAHKYMDSVRDFEKNQNLTLKEKLVIHL
jgi:hypothetical protein